MFVRERRGVSVEKSRKVAENLHNDGPKSRVNPSQVKVRPCVVLVREGVWPVGRDEGAKDVERLSILGELIKNSWTSKSVNLIRKLEQSTDTKVDE